MLRTSTVAVAAAVLVLATGCAANDRPDAGASPATASPTGPEPPSTVLPTLGPPTAPPKSPSDPYPDDILVGRVLSDSDGPCYRLETDDGVVYAVHSTTAGRLAAGTTVRVQTATTSAARGCPGGSPVDAAKIEVVR
jgi:hypothetical protein